MTLDPVVAEIVKQALTWMLVVMGWMVVSDQQSARELGKNYFARFQVLRESLKKIEQAAVDHHTSAFDPVKVRNILRLISELSVEFSHLRKANSLPADYSYHVAAFRKAVTFDNFDVSTHAPVELTSKVIENIAVSKDLLDRALLEAAQSVSLAQPTLFQSVRSSFKRFI